jgi:photoactive yellow protein
MAITFIEAGASVAEELKRKIVSFQLVNGEVERFEELERRGKKKNKLYNRNALLRELVGLDNYDLTAKEDREYFLGRVDNADVQNDGQAEAERGRVGAKVVPMRGVLYEEGKQARACVFCGRQSKGGLCDECRNDLIGSAKVTREKLDGLPYGAIYLDRDGKIIGYNKEETRNISHLPRHRAIKKNFFTEVAPCPEVRELHERYDAFMRGEGPAGSFDVTYPFDDGKRPVRVLISFVRVDENRALVIAKKILAGEMRDEDTA